MRFLCFNGDYLAAEQPLLTAQNRSFRYGDGIFETIKVFKGQIILGDYHFDRLFLGLKLLNIHLGNISKEKISDQILDLCKCNNCTDSARVRLAVFRNEADNYASYVMEATPLQVPNHLNEKGWTVDIYPFARKSMDAFANLKTANYLPYVLADHFVKDKGIDECIVLNSENNLCDASKANIFLIKKDEVFTPALHQGCVSGVIRRFIVERLKALGIAIYQKEIAESMLFEADEVFLTNSINDMRWVKSFRQKHYKHDLTSKIYQQLFSTFYD